MNLIETALYAAIKAHEGQTDKAGQPYILHPLRLMSKMDTDVERAVALLHDVIEDSEYTAALLLQMGIPVDVVDAVQALTKKQGETYEDFIVRVKQNPLAAKVKRADLEDNMNILRLSGLDEKDLQRIAKYHKAWHQLQDE